MEAIQGMIHRIVESQEQVATAGLVDSLDEQALLEEVLERSKPPWPPGVGRLHYLLATPFRYPPLRHGSRFGRAYEPSLFYGGASEPAAMAEVAFYRCLFMADMSIPPQNPLITQHLLFCASYRTEQGVKLQAEPWADLHQALTHPARYDFTQQTGADMRSAGVDAFQFLSARALQSGFYQLPYSDQEGFTGVNVALFSPRALVSRKPRTLQRLLITTSQTKVQMSLERPDGSRQRMDFEAAWFQVDKRIPQPAG
jgi:hypothetical protein